MIKILKGPFDFEVSVQSWEILININIKVNGSPNLPGWEKFAAAFTNNCRYYNNNKFFMSFIAIYAVAGLPSVLIR